MNTTTAPAAPLYYYVLNPQGSVPRYRHETEDSARIEAARLAGMAPGAEFQVLAVIATCTSPPRTITWSDGWEAIPF